MSTDDELTLKAAEDARLLDAARDMLKALRVAVNQNEHDMLMTGEELRMCREAIRKATEGA